MNSERLLLEELSETTRIRLSDALIAAQLPDELYFRGNLDLLDRQLIAFAGSRQASPFSLAVIEGLAGGIASQQACVLSGGALGTDTAAHRGALQQGGTTIFIVPCPLEHIEPRTWRHGLANHIDMERCLFLSPFSPRKEVRRGNPLIRNRLIASLASAVVVGETAIQSGTNHFTKCALGLKLPVFFLRQEGNVSEELTMIYRYLKQKDAHPFEEQDALQAQLPRKILAAAKEFERCRRDEDSNQLRLCEAEEEYLSSSVLLRD